jgi:hypothetical protein
MMRLSRTGGVGWVRCAVHDAHHWLPIRWRAVTHRHLAGYAPPLPDVRAAPLVQGAANPPYEDLISAGAKRTGRAKVAREYLRAREESRAFARAVLESAASVKANRL